MFGKFFLAGLCAAYRTAVSPDAVVTRVVPDLTDTGPDPSDIDEKPSMSLETPESLIVNDKGLVETVSRSHQITDADFRTPQELGLDEKCEKTTNPAAKQAYEEATKKLQANLPEGSKASQPLEDFLDEWEKTGNKDRKKNAEYVKMWRENIKIGGFFTACADLGSARCQFVRGLMLMQDAADGNRIDPSMTEEQAYLAAYESFTKSAKQCFAPAEEALADMFYMCDKKLKKSNDECDDFALKYFNAATSHGLARAKRMAARLYVFKGDESKGLDLYLDAAEAGDEISKYYAAILLIHGDEEKIKRDVFRADLLLKECSETVAGCQRLYGLRLRKNDPSEEDRVKGRRLIRCSATAGSIAGMKAYIKVLNAEAEGITAGTYTSEYKPKELVRSASLWEAKCAAMELAAHHTDEFKEQGQRHSTSETILKKDLHGDALFAAAEALSGEDRVEKCDYEASKAKETLMFVEVEDTQNQVLKQRTYDLQKDKDSLQKRKWKDEAELDKATELAVAKQTERAKKHDSAAGEKLADNPVRELARTIKEDEEMIAKLNKKVNEDEKEIAKAKAEIRFQEWEKSQETEKLARMRTSAMNLISMKDLNKDAVACLLAILLLLACINPLYDSIAPRSWNSVFMWDYKRAFYKDFRWQEDSSKKYQSAEISTTNPFYEQITHFFYGSGGAESKEQDRIQITQVLALRNWNMIQEFEKRRNKCMKKGKLTNRSDEQDEVYARLRRVLARGGTILGESAETTDTAKGRVILAWCASPSSDVTTAVCEGDAGPLARNAAVANAGVGVYCASQVELVTRPVNLTYNEVFLCAVCVGRTYPVTRGTDYNETAYWKVQNKTANPSILAGKELLQPYDSHMSAVRQPKWGDMANNESISLNSEETVPGYDQFVVRHPDQVLPIALIRYKYDQII